MARTEREKMRTSELYRAGDPELVAGRDRARAWMQRYNADVTRPSAARHALLAELFNDVGRGAAVLPPFRCDYGTEISLGEEVFLNFGCVILDGAPVRIGALTQIGPGVQLITADHPRDPAERRAMLEFSRPVTIGANVWIGAGAIILPGVTVGDDAIVGAGSIVTRDVPPGATVAGNPARAIRSSGRI